MISEKILKNLEEQNKKDPSQAIIRRALSSTRLSDAVKVVEASRNTQFRFSDEIKTLPITNQKQSGRCWIFSGLNFLREKTANDLKLPSFEFSQNYVAFYDKLEKINYFLEAIDDFLTCKSDDRTLLHLLNAGIQDGGQWQMFANIVKKYGLVPKEVMPETFQSSASYGHNSLINIKLRKYAADARRLAKNNELNKIPGLKEQTLKELYNLLVATLGVPPQNFDFEYVDKDNKYHLDQNLTPKKFYDKYVGLKLEDYVSVINAPTSDKPYYNLFTVDYLGNVVEGDPIVHLNIPMNELKDLVIKQLKDSETVWFGSDVSYDGDRTTGVWDDNQFDFENSLGINLELSKEDKLDYRVSTMNHAMTLTGVNLVNGKPNKWKIQNSWGDAVGLKGYYLCSDTWFDKYVYQALINKKHLTKKQQEALTKKVKRLKPWDPMGSLAD